MYKSFATDDHPEMLAAAGGRAFQYFDRSDKMTKSASDAVSREDIQRFMPPHTHFGVHLTTMGTEEDFGANRNGDSASRAALDKYHGTFEKYGAVFREHANKCARTQGVGVVKLARVNHRARRGELIVWVDKDKAPDMHKAAKAGDELSWSMSMRLPHDRCSCCDKTSRRTSDYCAHLKSAMLKYVPEFRKYAYARNEDDVKFFDISEVKRRADRIATYLGYMFNDDAMAKAAAEGRVITGAEWAAVRHPHIPVPFKPWEDLTLRKLVKAADFVRHADADTLRTLAACAPSTLSQVQIDVLAKADFRSVAGELAKRGMIIDFPTFACIITGDTIDELRKDADFRDVEGLQLPQLLEGMESNGGCECGEEAADAVAPDEWGTALSPQKDEIDSMIKQVGDDLGMSDQPVLGRTLTITIKSASVRNASGLHGMASASWYAAMKEAYGHYLVKAAHIAKDVPGVSERTLFRSISAMLILNAQKDCQTGAFRS